MSVFIFADWASILLFDSILVPDVTCERFGGLFF